MLNYNSASELRAFLDREGLGMQKKFGQNFLINPQIRQALVDALGAKEGDEVWEIGPGLGAMTALLLEKDLKVKAFEIDLGFIRILKSMFQGGEKFELIEGDALKTWRSQEAAPFLLGNLPYNIAAALIADLIEKGQTFSRMVVTVQKEVALRMAASAGSPDYSSFSVVCASVYKVKTLMTIRPSSFFPQPNVDSMGVLLERRDKSGAGNSAAKPEYPECFYPLVRSLFESRRKTLKNNLLTFLSSMADQIKTREDSASSGDAGRRIEGREKLKEICDAVLKENSIDGGERAEKLEFDAFLSIAKTVENMRLLNSDVNCR